MVSYCTCHALTVLSSISRWRKQEIFDAAHKQQVLGEMPPYLPTMYLYGLHLGGPLFDHGRIHLSKDGPPNTSVCFRARSVRHWQLSRSASKERNRKPDAPCCGTHLLRIARSFLVAASALRAFRNRRPRVLMKCCQAWGHIATCFDLDTFPQCTDFLALKHLHADEAEHCRTRRIN